MGKGKGRRRRQANYLASHGGDRVLPPPATARDASAVPSKVRRIMNLKAARGENPLTLDSTPLGNSSSNRSDIQRRKKGKKGLENNTFTKAVKVERLSMVDEQLSSGNQTGESLSKNKKRKRQEGTHFLLEKFKATPSNKGLHDRKKWFLNEKKKKKKKPGYLNSGDLSRPLHQQEKINFGEVVDAPVKLPLPKKINISEEQLRQQAVEAYRQKKNWLSRPGSHQPPALANATATHF